MVIATRILFLVAVLAVSAVRSQPGSALVESLTPNRLVLWVWEQNPGIAELQAALEVAVERVEPAGSLADPMLSYAFAPRTFGREGQGLNQNIQLSQDIPWPGTLAAQRESAEQLAHTARRDIDVLRLDLAAAARSAYAEWYFLQRSLAIHHRTHALLVELRSVAEVRYAAGRALQQDVLQAELELTKLDRHLLKLTQLQASLLARMNQLLNREPTAPMPELARLDLPVAIPVLADLERAALDAHPTLESLDATLAARSADVTVAEKAFFPDLRLTAGYNSLWDEADKRPVIGISVNIPLDRSKRRSVLNGAKAAVQRVRWRREDARARLLAELTTAHAAVGESMQAVALYESSLVPLAQEYFSAARADYESGTGSFLAVITAEQQQLETEEALERNRADLLQRLAALDRATGAGLNAFPGVQP